MAFSVIYIAEVVHNNKVIMRRYKIAERANSANIRLAEVVSACIEYNGFGFSGMRIKWISVIESLINF